MKKLPTAIYNELLRQLIEKFPNTFSLIHPKILKLRIHKDIKASTKYTYHTIKLFLSAYCSTLEYKKAHLEGASRYDLEGNIAGEVTSIEAKDKQAN